MRTLHLACQTKTSTFIVLVLVLRFVFIGFIVLVIFDGVKVHKFSFSF